MGRAYNKKEYDGLHHLVVASGAKRELTLSEKENFTEEIIHFGF